MWLKLVVVAVFVMTGITQVLREIVSASIFFDFMVLTFF